MDRTFRRMLLPAVASAFALSGPAFAQFSIGANFQTVQGGSGAGSEASLTPPDTQGVAGTNHITILDNGRYKTFDKLGTTQFQTQSDGTFFANAGFAGGSIAGDPRLRFDPLSGRWFALNFTGQASNNNLVLAISAGADPTGVWKSIVIPTSSGTFADFPTLGVDKNGLYIATNNFAPGGGFQNVHLFTLAKSDLLWTGAGTPTTTNLTRFDAQNANNLGFTLQAANNYDVNQSGTNNRVISSFNSTNLRTFNIQGTGAAGATLGAGAFIGVSSMPSPPSATQPSGNAVQTNDNRIGGQTVQVGNNIYAVNAFDNGTGRSQVRFTVIDATTGTLVQQGNISSATLSYFFPSIAVNEKGHAVIGFSGSSSGQFISSYAAVSTAAGTLSFSTPTLVSAGVGNYVGFDGTPYRWGDYSATTVDPADTGIFWSFQERSTGTASQWGTQATEIVPTIAGETRWQGAATGNYSSAASWFGGAVPLATDHVIYSRNGAAYTVNLPAGTTVNDRISVRQGTTTFNIASGSTYQATNANAATPSFAVSEFLGTTNLTVSGGGTLQTVNATMAAGVNGLTTNNVSSATMTVTGGGTTWNNTGALYMGGNATRSGGVATLNVTGGGKVAIGGGGIVYAGSAMNVTGAGSLLNLNGSFAGGGTIAVGGGGTLSGNATLAPAVTINAGGILSPGNSPGTLTTTGGINMNAGTYKWELAALSVASPGTNFDSLAVNGGTNIFGGTSTVTLDFAALVGTDPSSANAFWAANHQWLIVDWNNVGTFAGTFSGLVNSTFSTGTFTLSGGNGDIFLNFTAVPEPGSLGLMGAAAAAGLFFRRRRAA